MEDDVPADGFGRHPDRDLVARVARVRRGAEPSAEILRRHLRTERIQYLIPDRHRSASASESRIAYSGAAGTVEISRRSRGPALARSTRVCQLSSSLSVSSCGLLVAMSSISGIASSGASTSSRLKERPVFFKGIGPRGLSSPFFLPLALPPR